MTITVVPVIFMVVIMSHVRRNNRIKGLFTKHLVSFHIDYAPDEHNSAYPV